MKKIFTALAVIAISALPSLLHAQTKEINEIFDRYEKKKSVESITISPALLNMSGSKSSQETRELINKISDMRILNIPSSASENGQPISRNLKNELDRVIKSYQFQRAVKVEEENSSFELYMINGNKGAVLFISSDSNEFTVISIFGEVDKTLVNSLLNGNIKVKK